MTDHDNTDNTATAAEGAARPRPSHLYNGYLGGRDNYGAEREAADRLMRMIPGIDKAAEENRQFVLRAVRRLVGEGIDQILDLGAGMPADPNVHEVARAQNPEARVVYVDNEDVVLAHGRAFLEDHRTTVIAGDVRRPHRILEDPALRATLDLERPVVLVLGAVLHFVDDDEDPYGIVAAFRDATVPGSRVVVSHVTDEGPPPEQVKILIDAYAQATAQLTVRSPAAIAAFFDGFSLDEHGLTRPGLWSPDEVPGPCTHWQLAGVGRLATR